MAEKNTKCKKIPRAICKLFAAPCARARKRGSQIILTPAPEFVPFSSGRHCQMAVTISACCRIAENGSRCQCRASCDIACKEWGWMARTTPSSRPIWTTNGPRHRPRGGKTIPGKGALPKDAGASQGWFPAIGITTQTKTRRNP